MGFLTCNPGVREPPPVFFAGARQNRASMRKLAALKPSLVCFGHGPPLVRTEILEKIVERIPRHENS
jgi:glyoxylase-like metal-dependent hydrolase (beta-lactamase superfamily II)